MINRLNLSHIMNNIVGGKFSNDSDEIEVNSLHDDGSVSLSAAIGSDTITIDFALGTMYATAYTYSESSGTISGEIIGQATIPDCTLTKFGNCLFNLCDKSVDLLTMSALTIETAPSKVAYTVGEVFNPAGMQVQVTYSDDSTELIPLSDLFIDKQTPLNKNDTRITISYTECGQTIKTVQEITVT